MHGDARAATASSGSSSDKKSATLRHTMTSPLSGRTFGRYRLIERIGAGAMGEVYRAHDSRLDRDVAIKVIHSKAIADEEARRRLRREADALSKLNHPNIATVLDVDSDGDVDFVVME